MKQTENNFSVLIPDGESHILIHVVNCLAQVEGVKIYIMSSQKNIAMRYSRYIHHFSFYKKIKNEIDWINNINEELEKFNIDVVMPIFEDGIRTIIKYKNHIEQKNKLCILPSFDNFKTAINKGLLSEFMAKHNILSPKFKLIEPNSVYNSSQIDFPVIVKPLEGFGGGQGIYIFQNRNEVKQFFVENKFDYTYLVQEYIKGYDIDCSVLCKDGTIIAHTIQKGTMIGKNIFSPQVGLEFLDNKVLYSVVEKLMKALNWSGVAHLDLRYDVVDKQYKVIEINTRFWVSLDASLIAGVNFPHLYCLTTLNKNFEYPTYRFIDYLSLKGLIKKIKKEKRFIMNRKFIMNNTPMKFVIKDPLPMIYKYVSRTKNILAKKFKTS